jgi:hypothetical protein
MLSREAAETGACARRSHVSFAKDTKRTWGTQSYRCGDSLRRTDEGVCPHVFHVTKDAKGTKTARTGEPVPVPTCSVVGVTGPAV